jgi:hypothetical protein
VRRHGQPVRARSHDHHALVSTHRSRPPPKEVPPRALRQRVPAPHP